MLGKKWKREIVRKENVLANKCNENENEQHRLPISLFACQEFYYTFVENKSRAPLAQHLMYAISRSCLRANTLTVVVTDGRPVVALNWTVPNDIY